MRRRPVQVGGRVGVNREVSTLLEVGCGTGHVARWFSEHDVQVMDLKPARPEKI